MENEKIKKVSIICAKGGLDEVYPALIMGNGARMEGMEASIFFTFFGLNAIMKKMVKKLKVATVGNPSLNLAMPMIKTHSILNRLLLTFLSQTLPNRLCVPMA